MKTCKRCGGEFPVDDFYVHKAMADGHLNFCKLCTRKRVGKHRENNLDSIREYDRSRGMLPHRIEARNIYIKTEQGKEVKKKICEKWNKRNPKKRKAEIFFRNYMRYHPELKQPCEVCSTLEKVQGHHEDYDKPLEVRWLCPKHHKARHKELKELGIIL